MTNCRNIRLAIIFHPEIVIIYLLEGDNKNVNPGTQKEKLTFIQVKAFSGKHTSPMNQS